MQIIVVVIAFFWALFILRSVYVIKESERAIIFRLGKFQRIMGPGVIVIVPTIDKLLKVDLDTKVPGWQALSKEQLEARIKDTVLKDR